MLPIFFFVIKPQNFGLINIPLVCVPIITIIAEFYIQRYDIAEAFSVNIPHGINLVFMIVFMINGFTTNNFLGNGGFLYWAGFISAMLANVIGVWVSLRITLEDKPTLYHKSAAEKSNNVISEKTKISLELKNSEEIYQKTIQKYNSTEKICNENIEALQTQIVTVEETYKTDCAEAEKQYTAAYNMTVSLYSPICSGIWDKLVNSYNTLLDKRDWKILDLVIWQLETGRADTVKEALQLADRETQANRIVQTMLSASASIAQQIYDGFTNLQTQINKSFYMLAIELSGAANAITRQIDRSTNAITREIDRSTNSLTEKIDENMQATNALHESQMDNALAASKDFKQLFSEVSLQRALMEKANTSSEKLIEEIKKLRT